jgi:hypothetical protein
MSRIFICYSRTDKTITEQVTNLLRRAYDHVWFDDNLHGGEEWWAEILKEIAGCQHFLFMLSAEALASDWCQKEIAEARRLDKHIVPVVVRATPDVPDHLQKIQQINMASGLTVDSLNQLYAALIRTVVSRTNQKQLVIDRRLLDRLWLFINGRYIEILNDQVQQGKVDWEQYSSHVTKYLDLRAKTGQHFSSILLEETFETFDDALIRLDGQISWTYILNEQSGRAFMTEPKTAHEDSYWIEKYNRLVRRAADVWMRHVELTTTIRSILPDFDVMKED